MFLLVFFTLCRQTAGLTNPPSFHPTGPKSLRAYVPDGLTPEQYRKLKERESNPKKLGMQGPRGFKSRSFDSFLKAKERGETGYNFPVNPDDIRSGKVALKDVPYMQRGGAWDNSDLSKGKGWMNTGFGMRAFNDGKAKLTKWTQDDKDYEKTNTPKVNNKATNGKPKNSGYQVGWGGVEVRTGSKLDDSYKPPKILGIKVPKKSWFAWRDDI